VSFYALLFDVRSSQQPWALAAITITRSTYGRLLAAGGQGKLSQTIIYLAFLTHLRI
jgi:hypothetical protein